MKEFTDISLLHPGVLLDYLNKVNSLKKRILSEYNSLVNKYISLEQKVNNLIENKLVSNDQNSLTVNAGDIACNKNSKGTINVDNNVDIKIDNLEQQSHSKVVICSGKAVENIIDKSNNTNVKSNIVKLITDKVINIESDDLSRVSLIGKDKKKLKVICSNESIKKSIISEARNKKPEGTFVTEFLTKRRNQLFYKARQIKRSNPGIKTSAYTRFGNIFFKFYDTGRYYHINSESDLQLIENLLSDARDVPNNDTLNDTDTSTADN